MATDWAALKARYVAGTMTMRELAADAGVKASGLMRRAANEDWNQERKQLSAQVSRAAVESVGDRRVADLAKFNEDDLSVARALRGLVARKLGSLALMAPGKVDSGTLASLARTASDAQKIGRLAMGAETESVAVGHRNLEPLTDADFLG